MQLIDDHVKAYVVFDVHGKDMTLQLEGENFLVPIDARIAVYEAAEREERFKPLVDHMAVEFLFCTKLDRPAGDHGRVSVPGQ